MKKALSSLMIFAMLIMALVVPTEVFHAYEANLSVGVSSSSVKIGDTVTVTIKVPGAVSGPVSLYFPTDVMEYVSASTEASVTGGTVQVSIGKGGRAASDTVTVKLKAKTSGTANIQVSSSGDIYDFDSLEAVTLKGASATVTVENQASAPEGNGGGGSADSQQSADNSLSSLKLSAGSLSPGFKPNTTKYTASVDYSVTSVVVSAKTSNAKAVIESVTGDGTVSLDVGKNTIEVVVRAENGVKAKYTIVVTRKTEAESAPQPSESESEEPVVNEMLQWNGEQLQATKEIPKESIPVDFEETSLVVNGQQMPGLSFGKGELKLVYLNNTNGAGSLYVYDEEQQTIYPFIKLESEKSYVMVLLPNEQKESAPEGFESCTFSIEGKGLVSAYQLKDENSGSEEETESLEDSTSAWNIFGAETFFAAEPKVSEFYLIYCMNDAGEKGWYMYDSVEETFQRYLVIAPSVEAGADVDLESENAKLQKELNAAKTTQYIIIAIAAAVVIILVVVLVVVILKNRPKEDFFEEYDDEDDYDDYYRAEDYVQDEDDLDDTDEVDEEDEDEDEEEDLVAKAMQKIVEAEAPKTSESTSVVDDGDLEFIDFD